MRKFIIIIVILICIIALFFLYWPVAKRKLAQTHQEAIIIELKNYGDSFADIETFEQAEIALEKIEYIKNYYKVDNGYRSHSDTELRLESQREKTISIILEKLQDFSKQDFGDDLNLWREYIQNRKHSED